MSTTIVIQCMFCKHIIGHKEGHGQTGVSSGICNACLWQYYPEYAAEVLAARERRAA